MRNPLKILIILAAILILPVGGIFLVSQNLNNKPSPEVIQLKSTIVVESFDANSSFSIVQSSPQSVLELITKLAEENNTFSFTTKEYSFGKFITVINDIEAKDTEFWGLYINSEMAQLGISEQMVNPGDAIKFVLTEISFN